MQENTCNQEVEKIWCCRPLTFKPREYFCDTKHVYTRCPLRWNLMAKTGSCPGYCSGSGSWVGNGSRWLAMQVQIQEIQFCYCWDPAIRGQCPISGLVTFIRFRTGHARAENLNSRPSPRKATYTSEFNSKSKSNLLTVSDSNGLGKATFEYIIPCLDPFFQREWFPANIAKPTLLLGPCIQIYCLGGWGAHDEWGQTEYLKGKYWFLWETVKSYLVCQGQVPSIWKRDARV